MRSKLYRQVIHFYLAFFKIFLFNFRKKVKFCPIWPQKGVFLTPISYNFTQILKITIEMNSLTLKTYVWRGHTWFWSQYLWKTQFYDFSRKTSFIDFLDFTSKRVTFWEKKISDLCKNYIKQCVISYTDKWQLLSSIFQNIFI